jgi:flagellar protein FliS
MVPTGILAYRKTQVSTASPVQLVIQLYEGAIRFTEQGIRAIEASNPAAAHHGLVRAQAIVTELRATLNPTTGEVAQSLDRVYDLIYRQLLAANVGKDAGVARLALAGLQELLIAWDQVAREGTCRGGADVAQARVFAAGAR